MRDAQKPDHVSLTTLIGHLREGRYEIPDFQREFEWMPWDIQSLMRSIFLDYYIGSLLLWKGKPENFDALACEPLYGFEGRRNATHIVLDGQQRLTAMHYAFLAPNVPVPGRKNRFLYFIRVDKFMEEIYDEAFEYDWKQRGENLLANTEAQFESHLFPLAVVGKGGWELPNWVQGYEKYWLEKEAAAKEVGQQVGAEIAARNAVNARRFGEHLKAITEQYQVAYIELDRDLEIDKICDIFTQINSRGIRLDIFDLINALVKPKGLQLKHMWREARERLSFVETERMNVYILQVMSVLRQAYCSPKYLYYLLPGQEKKVREPDGTLRKEILIRDISEFEELWHTSVEALEGAIKALRHPQEFGAISAQYLPYVSILPAFASIQTAARSLPPNKQLDARRKLRHWYWASVFTNRYSGSVESTTARDYLDLKTWFESDIEPAVIGEFKARFRNLELHRETRRGTSVYNGIFNLLVLRGAQDWMTGSVPQYDDLDDHHIVPKSWAKDNKLETSIDTILNRTPLTANTNRKVISDRLPNAYLPELILQNGEETVRATLESHFISPTAFDILLRNPFTPTDYEAFVAERQRVLLEAIEDLLIKERIDLPPQLRELDNRVENVEISLRTIISGMLKDDPAALPQHVRQKIDNRLRAALKKDTMLEEQPFRSLNKQLEFADLRDLQDIITNKMLWSNFHEGFGNKEILVQRFDQLAELRNRLRHSRALDEIARKDGEAALLWFEHALKKNWRNGLQNN